MMENGIQSPDPDRRIAAKLLLGGGDALSSLHRYATAAERGIEARIAYDGMKLVL